ncbi:carbohydrate esterase family 3 protein [Cylindrobasidium torrendii FP15055 ss-10]|uniref:Carbohydrate esterase family 3 protein n=1 Tax=Cylindrobasidium torrendii FP15055 ss-10 TaxID=1314674 RepID=A0A0D7BSW7_9AGAR|nr:carbohydrate esterase family 3 protein [Cylindrobasidium torrendii FP15055 ss-10]
MFFSSSFVTLAFALNAYAFTGKTARIMPLGASITYGTGSTNENGYRKTLYNNLVADGNTVNMVGTRQGGDFADTDNEGWPGYIIDQVLGKAQESMPLNRPNLVTLLVGTNDMVQNKADGALDRLGGLIDYVLDYEPTLTTVLVSSLPPNGDADSNSRIDTYNAGIPGVVQARVDAGRSVIFVDSHAVIAVGDLVDGTHPNDAGYERIAKVFYDGIVEAEAKGWLWDVDGPAP